jgi:hypothetical protein
METMERIITRVLALAVVIAETRADIRAGGFFHPLKRQLKLKLFKCEEELRILRELI